MSGERMGVPEQVVPGQRVAAGSTPEAAAFKAPWKRLWILSDRVFESKGLKRLRDRVTFVLKARRLGETMRPFIEPGGSLARAMAFSPEMVGAVVWPYICARWDAATRLECIRSHFEAVDVIGQKLAFPMDQSLVLLDLGDLQPSLRVVLDQPRWFMREGQFVLNLFDGETRIYSVAFSLSRVDDVLCAYVGAIQGGNTDGVMAEYKDLTKTLHGMRPRDFLVELVRSLCKSLGVVRIHAVADGSRQHRSSYFGDAKSATLSLNYDDIWSERGGVKASEDFFMLAIEAPLKPLEEIASKKRAMYRRRYEMLADLEQRTAAAWKL